VKVLGWLAVVAFLLSGCTGTSQDEKPAGHWSGLTPAQQRVPLAPLRGETLGGKPLNVADFNGKVVVLNFWASWCNPCRAEGPVLREAAIETGQSGVQFVGVNFKNDRAAALAFERKMAPGYPSLYDQPGTSLLRLRKFAPSSPPTTLLLDREGRFAGRFTGAVRLSELLDAVRRLAQEPAAPERRG
jgi:thiol-disulfide isomerase/thioredoxin